MVTQRFRTDLVDVAFESEDNYGVQPPANSMGTSVNQTKGTYARQWGLVTGGITLPNPRYEWQQFFGIGLVKTAEDFGVQGEKPSHPQLLDWLALQFIDSKWNLKALNRRIVLSATYRQTSRVTSALRERDPDNRLLARMTRQRLPSWMIRDQALFVSGLLVEKRGGPSVKPYQPAGIWAEATFGKKKYTPGKGEALYRRSLYTFWRRIVGPTMFFDEARRQTCEVRRSRTNTPLHALITLNDTTYIEAARAMAQRVLKEAPANDASRITHAFRLATARAPKPAELKLLTQRIQQLRASYAKDEAATTTLLAPRPSSSPTRYRLPTREVCPSMQTLLSRRGETYQNA